MKPKLSKQLLVPGALLALFALSAPLAGTADDSTSSTVLEVSGGVASVSGSEAAYAQRHQISPSGFGGIERYEFSSTMDTGTLTIEGHALAGNNDYALRIRFVNDERGSFEIGYREFRVWYDPTGSAIAGVVATANGLAATQLLGEDALAIDRSSFWIDGMFNATPNLSLHLKYTHNERNGQKDTTSQGDSNLTGGLGTRAIVPSFYDIDEKQDLVQFDATLKADKSEVVGAVIWDQREIDNARYERRRPFESSDRTITHRETGDTDLFSFRAYARHEYNDQLSLNAAYSHTKLDSVLGGSRITGAGPDASFDPTFANRQNHDEGFFDLSGTSQTTLNVANINVLYMPTETFSVIPSFRVERETRDVMTAFEETAVGSNLSTAIDEIEVESNRKWDEWVFSVESRYTGFKNWVLIGRAIWSKGDGELSEDNLEEGITSLVNRDSLITKWTEKYALTANWYATPGVNFSFNYSYWDRYTDYDTLDTSADSSISSGDRYPAFIKSLDLKTNDFTARMTLHPAMNVTLVTRIDAQKTTIDGNELGLNLIESGKYDTTMISQSVNWNPVSRLFIQGMINHVKETLHTPANDLTGAAANIVLEQMNDYWTTGINVGFAADEQNDFFVSYDYFFADNFVDNSAVSTPYGLDRQDQTLSATWVRHLNDRTKFSFRYAYAKNVEDSAVGLKNFDASLFYGKVEYRF